jgi:hypothetical protein
MTTQNAVNDAFLDALLLDRANYQFLDGSSSKTAGAKRILSKAIVTFCIVIPIGVLLVVLHNHDEQIARHLQKFGNTAQGLVVGKRATSSGQGRDSCYVTYEFRAARSPGAAAALVAYRSEVEVSDSVFDQIAEGQSTPVIYDPRDPATSMLALSIRSPRYPAWLVLGWWAGSITALGFLFSGYSSQNKYSKGTLIRGAVMNITRKQQSGTDTMEVNYSFVSPSGARINAAAQNEVEKTNLLLIPTIVKKHDCVGVLWLSDTSFMIL